jgi:hypothetical protein
MATGDYEQPYETIIKEQRNAQALAENKSENYKKDLELSRYKQDCRKRALEMAHDDFHAGKMANGSKVGDLAETYYNWLISIPE